MFLRGACHRAVMGLIALASFPRPQLAAQPPQPPDPLAVRSAMIPRINDRTYRGLIGAWGDDDSLRFAAAGVTTTLGAPIDQTTVFELGEIGNLFTSAVLASLVVRGELSLDDPVQKFVPGVARLTRRESRPMTLGDLAFHRSGLTASAGSGAWRTSARSDAQLIASLRTDAEPGARYVWSQRGISLLEIALERHLHMPIADAVRRRVLAPLGVEDITTGTGAQRGASTGRRATGHTQRGAPLEATAASATRWRGSASALALFTTASSDTVRGPLARAFALMMRTRSPGPDASLPVALGWRVLRLNGRDIYWHDALDAPGFSSYVAIDPGMRRSVAVLSNTARPVDAIAGQLLLGRVPVIAPAPPSGPTPRQPPTRSRRRGRR